MTAIFAPSEPETYPNGPFLVIPNRANLEMLKALRKELKRRVVWLMEEGAEPSEEIADYLEATGEPGLTFSIKDGTEECGQAVRDRLGENGVGIFVPGEAIARAGTNLHFSGKIGTHLCGFGLPVVPAFVECHDEFVFPGWVNPQTGVTSYFGEVLTERDGLADLRKSFLELGATAFSKKEVLQGSLATALLHGLKQHGENHLTDGTDDSQLNFKKLLIASVTLSRELRQLTKKKRIGIILPPGKGGLVANLAVLFAGKVAVNLNFKASQQAIQSAIRQAEVDKFITADPFVRKVPEFPWPPNRDLIFIERILPQIKKKMVKWAVLTRLLPENLLTRLLGLKDQGDDEALLLFTSGSSGEPKGVPLSHKNLLANVLQFGGRIDLPKDSTIFGSLPLFHSFGATVTLWYPIIYGLNLVTYPNPLEAKRIAELVSQHEVTLLLVTPTLLRSYMRRVDPELLSCLKLVVTGAEKLPENLAYSFQDRFKILPMEGYGLTETSPATNVNLPDLEGEKPVVPSARFNSVGPLLPGLALKMTSPTTDKEIPVTSSGIIWFKGANVFKGYLNKPELNEEILQDGWFKTGDVGRLDEEGFLHIEGRMSRFSKVAGEMVPHETIEAAINQALGLDGESERKIAVMGVKDEKKGEALVILSTISGQALEQECLDIRYKLMDAGIPSTWCPREIIPVEHIPVLATGKMDLAACKALLEKNV